MNKKNTFSVRFDDSLDFSSLNQFGTIHFSSPVMNLVYLSTDYDAFVIASIDGVLQVEKSVDGYLTNS